MLPIWIIDLGGSEASQAKLQDLLGSMDASLKPYWHYYPVAAAPVSDGPSCKALLEAIVADGRACYNDFIKSGYAVSTFQIVMLGAADQALTQSVFAPLPGLIRDALPRIVSDHANLGVEVTGILYIPSTINQVDDVRKRERAALLLEEVNLLCSCLGAKHFNRVVAYQDVQYKDVRFYPGLRAEQCAELLFQLLCNLFLVKENTERLFDKTGQESGIFSLGVASVYYNSEQHRSYELKRLLDKLLAEFKDKDNTDGDYALKRVREMLEADVIAPETLSARITETCGGLDANLKKMLEEADPHPVWDLFRSDLLPLYYRKFLKYMPARLTRFLQSLSYTLLTSRATILRRNREKAAEGIRAVLREAYRKVLLDKSAHFATIAQMESFFKEAEACLEEQKKAVTPLLLEVVPVPKYLRNEYNQCMADEQANKPQAILELLKKNLKKEPVVLALLVRCFLLGILLVFTVIPLIRVVSPTIINLGGLPTIEWLWIPVLFFIPLVVEFFIKLRRHFKRIKRLKYRLLAATLLHVNRQLSQQVVQEQNALYDALMAECAAQLEELGRFRELLSASEEESTPPLIPQTLFNQPLSGGAFMDEKLVEDDSAMEAHIRVKDETLPLSRLEKEDLLELLKQAFLYPETVSAANLADDKGAEIHALAFVACLGGQFASHLEISAADNVSDMLRFLEGKVNRTAWEKMAGVNGMLFSHYSDNKPVVRMEGDYAFYTTWQKLSPGLMAPMLCNCALDPLPALSFADKLSLLYAYFRKKDLAYTLAGLPVRISKAEMEQLEKEIGG